MPGSTNLVKAKLTEVNLETGNEIAGHEVKVQFNPETLKVSFANQLKTPEGGASDQRGTPAQQYVGAGTTKLVLQLWFDVNAPQEGNAENDVRKMTEKVAYFITPKEDPPNSKKFIPPGVRFIWGSFQFDGLMESLEESLEFFSSEGIPLRANVSMNLSQQKVDQYKFPAKASPKTPPTTGTRPLTPAPSGSSVQNMAANQSGSGDWQSIAAANGIENPRQLAVGQLLDLNVKAGVSVGTSGSVPLFNDIGASANLTVQASLETE